MDSVWKLLSCEPRAPNGVLTDEFVMKFSRQLDWELLSINYDFTIDMLRIYFHRVNWAAILKRQKFNESFLREMAPNFEDAWHVVSKYQTLSESFIHDYASKLDWEYITKFQITTQKFLDDHKVFIDEQFVV